MCAAARNDMEEQVLIPRNNDVYGRPCENLRKGKDVHLSTTRQKRATQGKKTNWLDVHILDEHLFGVEMHNVKLLLLKTL